MYAQIADINVELFDVSSVQLQQPGTAKGRHPSPTALSCRSEVRYVVQIVRTPSNTATPSHLAIVRIRPVVLAHRRVRDVIKMAAGGGGGGGDVSVRHVDGNPCHDVD